MLILWRTYSSQMAYLYLYFIKNTLGGQCIQYVQKWKTHLQEEYPEIKYPQY